MDCSQIKEEDAQTIRDVMTDNVGGHIGDLSETDCKKVIDALNWRDSITRNPSLIS